jgi:hypothetical protein
MVFYDDESENMNNSLMMDRIMHRRRFNVENVNDMSEAKKFFESYKWGSLGCPFTLEVPWENIPDMLKDKITKYHLKIKQ